MTVVRAAITQTTPCDERPTITQQPQSLTAPVGGAVEVGGWAALLQRHTGDDVGIGAL